MWVCQSDSQWLNWDVSDYICASEVAKEKSKGKNSKDKPGTYKVARPKMRKELPLPSREDYYHRLAEDAAVHNKGRKKSSE